MEALAAYGSDSEDDTTTKTTQSTAGSAAASSSAAAEPASHSLAVVNVTPAVSVDDRSVQYVDPTARSISVNVPYEAMYAPVQGPANPFRPTTLGQRNILTGYVEEDALDEFTFEAQRRTFMTYGYALDPSANAAGQRKYVGDASKAAETDGATVFDKTRVLPTRTRKRKDRGDAFNDPLNYEGPWAGFEGERMALKINDGPGHAEEEEGVPPPTVEYEGAEDDEAGAGAGAAEDGEGGKLHMPGSERTIFHGKAEKDYMGRPWTTVPLDIDVNLLSTNVPSCFLPKKHIHTWTGHTKGINAVRWFPRTAHLLLSASMDNRIKIWQMYHDRACMRTYIGHSKSVRDICFNNDGTQFLSASYDRHIKLWDTETGRCLTNFSTKGIPYCVKFNPSHQSSFLAGCNNKKILQFDLRTHKVVQEYDSHLGAINSITFVDGNRRFVSTSDDKTIRVWDWGIPVVIKYVADPSMHSVPTATIHPGGKWWLGQSLDNQILVYGALDRFKSHKSKNFKGHNVAGYACQIGCSPDGRFISSGDSEGNVHFWDWKTCKPLKRMKCHNQVVIANDWHPHETSKMITGSWDGTIKLWD